ncbi:hypothetical protein GH714_016144 [Hevea brasiliensis]|uniref:Uncharacterized protein n=1 Tax=Hevea brasiliensis TaxID=3981 RepID=A0A6A6M1S4_HEVBR|nr:hypothetical protein GH714_016144 [Hevea brasiliensis]
MSSSGIEPEAPDLVCQLDNVQGMVDAFSAVRWKRQQDAVVELSEHGIVLIVEEIGCLQAKVYLQKELFVQYEYNAQGRPRFGVSLGLFVDCLNTFSVPGHSTAIEIRYPGPDMQLLLKSVDSLDACIYAEIRTRIPDTISWDYNFEPAGTTPLSFTVKSAALKEAIDDLEWPGSSIQIILKPVPPSVTFRGEGHGDLQLIYPNTAIPTITLPNNEKIPAVFVFGDSIVDTGNNNNIKTLAKCNYPPYGRDFNGGKPTGRFSNGRVPSDFIAEAFGVKKLLPAYLDPNLREDLLTGVCFASGGNGFDNITSSLPPAFTLSDQLQQFKDYIKKINSAVGEERSATIVSKGIFIICTGTNDILTTYYTTPFRRFHYTIDSYADFLISLASSFIKELHGLGARRFGVLSLPPIGCVPSQRTIRGGLKRKCLDYANKAAILFNSKLASAIHALNSTFSDSNLIYLDVYNPLISLIQNPAKYGMLNA